MARGVSPEVMARRLDLWASKGLNYAMVVGAKEAFEIDKAAAIARVRKKTGTLAGTIRVTEPSATRTARKGSFRISLAAGSRSRSKPVPYAGVLQTGATYGGANRTKAHVVGNGVKFPDGQVRDAVRHPGSRLVKLEYLRVDLARAQGRIDVSIGKSARAEL